VRILNIYFLSVFPGIAFASDFSGFAGMLFLIYILFPILIIENLLVIYFYRKNRFKSEKSVARVNIPTFILILLGFLAYMDFLKARTTIDVTLGILGALIICLIIPIYLPNKQFRLNKNA